MQLLEFTLIGLATGAIYALVAQGLVLVYRGSGVLNLSQGAFVMVGGYAYYELSHGQGLPLWAAVIGAVVICSLLAAATQVLVLQRTVHASPLTRVIATLGVLIVMQSAAQLWFGVNPINPRSWLPTASAAFLGARVGQDLYFIFAIGCALTFLLWLVFRYSPFGRVATAVAESPDVAASLGHSPAAVSTINWAIGGALAGLAGTLVGPITLLQPAQLTLLVLPGMLAALVGSFRSFPLALVGALAIGVMQSVLQLYTVTPGLSDAVPYLVIILFMVARGTGIPLRSQVLDRLPAVGSGRIRLVPVVICLAILCAVILSDGQGTWSGSFTVTFAQAIIVVSVVVISGYAGQLSLAQYVIAGAGAFIAARFSLDLGFVPALLIAICGGMLLAGLMSLASLRTRGITLALISLGLALTVSEMLLSNDSINGGAAGLTVGSMTIFGLNVNPLFYPQRYALLALALLTVICLLVANLRRGAFGRRLLAVRSNERAALAAGVNVYAAKISASMLAGGIAAVGGTLLAFMQISVLPSQFDVFTSLMVVGVAVVGGLGYIGGAFIGVLSLPGGVVSQLLSGVPNINTYLPLAGGVALILSVRAAPDGLWRLNQEALATLISHLPVPGIRRPAWPARWRSTGRQPAGQALPGRPAATAAGGRRDDTDHVLTLDGASVAFGGVRAVDDLSLSISSGQVHGLIGPNGAGKTTAIDAMTGFVRMTSGRILLDGQDVTRWSARRRARAGIARSFQSLELFADLTVRENIAVAHDGGSRWSRLRELVWSRPAQLSPLAAEAAQFCELTPHLDERADSLSFGQQKLVAIARAIAAGPCVLLLDEPAAGLDDREAVEFAQLVSELARGWHIAVLLVEHNVQVVMSLCDQITVMNSGRLLAVGTPAQVQANSAVLDAYLGSSHVLDEAAS